MATKTKTKKEKTEEISQEQTMLAPRPIEEFNSFMETGCVAFDLEATDGKGLPVSGNILLFAPPATGKTTLIADILRRLLVKYETLGIPFRVVYIDTENSISVLSCMGKDKNHPEELGLSKYITRVQQLSETEYSNAEYRPQQLIYYPNVGTFKLAENIFERYVRQDDEKENQDVKIIVIDSLNNLTSTTLTEADVDKADFGSNAKERTRFYQKWLFRLRLKNITTIFTSQMRQKQNATAYEDPLRAAITEADKHSMDIIMRLSKSTDSKRLPIKKVKQKTIDGVVEVQTRYLLKLSTKKAAGTKNRFWDALDVECLVKPGYKTLNAYTVFNILENNNLYKRLSSVTYTASEELAMALPDIDFGDLDKGVPKKELNQITSRNLGRLIEYLKTNNMYSIAVGEVEDNDDGFEC